MRVYAARKMYTFLELIVNPARRIQYDGKYSNVYIYVLIVFPASSDNYKLVLKVIANKVYFSIMILYRTRLNLINIYIRS